MFGHISISFSLENSYALTNTITNVHRHKSHTGLLASLKKGLECRQKYLFIEKYGRNPAAMESKWNNECFRLCVLFSSHYDVWVNKFIVVERNVFQLFDFRRFFENKRWNLPKKGISNWYFSMFLVCSMINTVWKHIHVRTIKHPSYLWLEFWSPKKNDYNFSNISLRFSWRRNQKENRLRAKKDRSKCRGTRRKKSDESTSVRKGMALSIAEI